MIIAAAQEPPVTRPLPGKPQLPPVREPTIRPRTIEQLVSRNLVAVRTYTGTVNVARPVPNSTHHAMDAIEFRTWNQWLTDMSAMLRDAPRAFERVGSSFELALERASDRVDESVDRWGAPALQAQGIVQARDGAYYVTALADPWYQTFGTTGYSFNAFEFHIDSPNHPSPVEYMRLAPELHAIVGASTWVDFRDQLSGPLERTH